MVINNFGGGIDTSDATATASDILKDKIAYAKEQKITGKLDLSNDEIIDLSKTISLDIPYEDFEAGAAVVYHGEIHLLGGWSVNEQTRRGCCHYKYNGVLWEFVSLLPYCFFEGSAVVYNDEIHILGGSGEGYASHAVWNGSKWTVYENSLPYNFYNNGLAVVYNNELHILGPSTSSSSTKKRHYKWNGGSSWSQVSTLPYTNFEDGAAVVYNNEIHILGGSYDGVTNHYKWDGTSWNSVSTLPYSFIYGFAVVYNNEIHILGGNTKNHYKWNGSSWESVASLPYTYGLPLSKGTSVVYNDEIYIFGCNTWQPYTWGIFNGSYWELKKEIPFICNFDCNSVIYNNKLHFVYDNSFSWDGKNWYKEAYNSLPYNKYIQAVVYNNEIHVLGGYYESGVNNTLKHYKWNGSSWVSVSTLPFDIAQGRVVIYNNEIHILESGTRHYKWNGTSWNSVSTSPGFSQGEIIVYNNEIHMFNYNGSHYVWNGSSWSDSVSLPTNSFDGEVAVHANKIHILYRVSENDETIIKHLEFDGTSFNELSDLEISYKGELFNFVDICELASYKNNLYIFSFTNKIYKWDAEQEKWIGDLDNLFLNLSSYNAIDEEQQVELNLGKKLLLKNEKLW